MFETQGRADATRVGTLTNENRRVIPGLVKQGINTTYDPTRSSLMFSTIDVMVAQAHIDQLNELADAKRLVKADRH
ncbi:MAG: hypothetical protein KH092_07400 [Actinomyces sp.]|nr:hypothetical protein [Actinomyces sp.]